MPGPNAPSPSKNPNAPVPTPKGVRAEDIPSERPAVGHESVDLAHRPGRGERVEDAERPKSAPDSESQNGGRTLEEELAFRTNDDDAGGLPHQQLANRGALPTDEGKIVD